MTSCKIFAGISGISAILFIAIAVCVQGGYSHALDDALLLALRQAHDAAEPLGPWWVKVMFTDLTHLGSVAVLVCFTLLASGALLASGQRFRGLYLVLVVAAGQGLNTLLKALFNRTRPDIVPHLGDVYTSSFPSAHAMLSAVVFLTIGMIVASLATTARLKVFSLAAAVFFSVLIGFSRLYIGVHYPSDVLAGWCAGVAWVCGCWLVVLYRGDTRVLPFLK